MKLANFEQRFWAKVRIPSDVIDGCWQWCATTVRNGYGQISVGTKMKYAHRVAFELVRGAIPEGKQIDHQCHNRACVNPGHMRLATCRENNQNRAGKKTGRFSSTLLGVSWHSQRRKWVAQIMNRRQPRYLGLFETEQEAHAAYLRAVQEVETKHER